jgi:microcin C transport system ATP-binding protein
LPIDAPALLSGQGIACHFERRGSGWRRLEFTAVEGADLELRSGETLGIVGESGSGKTTLGMSLLRLSVARVEGRIEFAGERIDQLGRSALRARRRAMQVVFQDPFNALSPRLTVESIIAEGLGLHRPELDREARRQAIAEVLREVGLEPTMMDRYPHEFSGGQRQRIAIARVVVLRPQLLLLDEPTSALDVSVQKQVLELLIDLQRRYRMSYLFITHDLTVIRAIAHRVIVMRAGQIVERGEMAKVFDEPAHPYTRTLLEASL